MQHKQIFCLPGMVFFNCPVQTGFAIFALLNKNKQETKLRKYLAYRYLEVV
jgi:hypothetical protein